MIASTVNIISTYDIAQRFRKLTKFELDLGKRNLKKMGNDTVLSITDKFVDMVFNDYGFLVNKFGKYGSITFYYSSYGERDKIYIFFDKTEHEVTLPLDVINLEEWLSLQLYEIQEKNKITTNASN